MAETELSRDTQAVLLLCGRFAPREEVDPLDIREYNRVVELLQQRSLRHEDLLNSAVAIDWSQSGLDAGRMANLLGRSMALGLATERWTNAGLWVISRGDDAYPTRLRQHLGRSAPPLLWGVGELNLPDSGGVAIVGSRDVDEGGATWAEDLAEACAREGITVISGGARGTDLTATAAALGAGGKVVAVLPEGLGRPSVVSRFRQPIVEGRLVLLSPFYPDAGFTVGTAMARNKVIYGLAEAAVIVRADAHSGGTWAGAVEELKRDNSLPVFVRADGDPPEGNRALLLLGARELPSPPWLNLRALISAPEPWVESLPGFFSQDAPERRSSPAILRDAPMSPSVELCSAGSSPVYEAVLPILLAEFAEPKSIKEAAEALDVEEKQLRAWLERGLESGLFAKVKGKTALFVRRDTHGSRSSPVQGGLFETASEK